MNEHGAGMNAVDLKAVGRGEVAYSFEIRVPEPLIVQDTHGSGVTLEVDELVIRDF